MTLKQVPPRLGEDITLECTVTGIKFLPKRGILRVWQIHKVTGKQIIIDYPQDKLEDLELQHNESISS